MLGFKKEIGVVPISDRIDRNFWTNKIGSKEIVGRCRPDSEIVRQESKIKKESSPNGLLKLGSYRSRKANPVQLD